MLLSFSYCKFVYISISAILLCYVISEFWMHNNTTTTTVYSFYCFILLYIVPFIVVMCVKYFPSTPALIFNSKKKDENKRIKTHQKYRNDLENNILLFRCYAICWTSPMMGWVWKKNEIIHKNLLFHVIFVFVTLNFLSNFYSYSNKNQFT